MSTKPRKKQKPEDMLIRIMRERNSQKKLLHEMVDRVVVSPEGAIQRLELQPPFAYLKEVTDRVRNGGGFEGKTKTSAIAGKCSSLLSLSEPGGKKLEHLSPLNPLLVEFLQRIAFPQNAQIALLETS